MKSRTLCRVPGTFTMLRLEPGDPVPAWALAPGTPFTAITRTADELSIIAPVSALPPGAEAGSVWRCLMLEGPFGLDEPGVVASVVTPLAAAGLSVFVVATYETDYFLVTDVETAVRALSAEGHQVRPDGEHGIDGAP